jgi:hypothetical protein
MTQAMSVRGSHGKVRPGTKSGDDRWGLEIWGVNGRSGMGSEIAEPLVSSDDSEPLEKHKNRVLRGI